MAIVIAVMIVVLMMNTHLNIQNEFINRLVN